MQYVGHYSYSVNWPSYGNSIYRAYKVTLKSVEPLVEYIIRVFEVEKILLQWSYRYILKIYIKIFAL